MTSRTNYLVMRILTGICIAVAMMAIRWALHHA
jgi:hypothetical protein